MRWISFDLLDLRVMELQLIFSEFNEHTTGKLSLVFAEIVQLNDDVVPLVGHVSVTVMLPSNWKLKSSKRASADGEEVALTEEWILHVLPITWMSCPNILVDLDSTASWEIRMYVDLSPFFGIF